MEKHFAVSGFVMNQSHTKLLMVYHKKMGVWVIPGGHLEENEYPFEGAKREVLEETGVEAKILDYSEVQTPESKEEKQIPNAYITLSESIPAKGDKDAHIHMDLIYLAEADENANILPQEDEVSDAKWMTFEEVLDSGTFDSIKQIVKRMLERGGETRCENSDL